MTPESRHFQDAKRVYEAEVRAIRQQYIAEVKQKFEEEQARQRCVRRVNSVRAMRCEMR